MSLLLIAFLSGAGIFALLTLYKGLFGEKSVGGERAFSIALIVIFIIRSTLVKGINYNNTTISNSDFGVTFGNFLLWFEATAVFILLLRPFFNFKSIRWFGKYIPVTLFSVFFVALPFLQSTLENTYAFYELTYLAIEVGFGFALSCYHHLNDRGFKIEKDSYLEVILVSMFINILTLPVHFVEYLSDKTVVNYLDVPKYISPIVLCLILGIVCVLYFLLKNSSKDKIKFYIVLFCLSAIVKYVDVNVWTDIFSAWNWPLGLCSLSLIILTGAIIFNAKKSFNFVFSACLFGCLICLLIPVYDLGTSNVLYLSDIISYYVTITVVISISVACLFLKVFNLPNLKEVFYSTNWFVIYFLGMVFVNVLFTSIAGASFEVFGETIIVHSSDFLLNNSCDLINKMGLNLNSLPSSYVKFTVNENTFVLRSTYQLFYILIYSFFAFGSYYFINVMINTVKLFQKKN